MKLNLNEEITDLNTFRVTSIFVEIAYKIRQLATTLMRTN